MRVPVSLTVDQNQDPSFKVWLSDQEIFFDRLREKDSSAFKILYRQYAAPIYGCIMRDINNEEKAKQILNQTFCDVWSCFSDYDATKLRVFTWINQLAKQNIRKTRQ